MNKIGNLNTYYKEELYRSLYQSLDHEVLDKTFMIPLTGYTLIRSDPYAGGTALCLEIAAQLTNKDIKVTYYDPSDSIYLHRLVGIKESNFMYVRPTEGISILDMIKNREMDSGGVHILDSINLLKDVYDLDKYTESFAKQIKKIDHKATIICSQKSNRRYGSLWGNVISISILQKRLINGIPVGHMALIKGPLGEQETYIEYIGGRISKGYLIAQKELLLSNSKSAVFEQEGVRVQGFWKFVDAMDNLVNGKT